MTLSPAFNGALSFLAGISLTLAFAPFDYWPLALLSIGILFKITSQGSARQVFWFGILFGLGYFGLGVSWVFVSMHRFGQLGTPMAFFMTALLVCYLSIYPALACYLTNRWFGQGASWMGAIAFASIWTLSEYLRGTLLTGFPWLVLAHASVDTLLAGWAPLLGELGMSWLWVLTAALLALWQWTSITWRVLLVGMGLIWALGIPLNSVHWTEPKGEARTISLVQGNIPQNIKWIPTYRQQIIDQFLTLSEPHTGQHIILWPEAALPILYHEAEEMIQDYAANMQVQGTTWVFGILVYDAESDTYYNSIHVPTTKQFYYKRKLVPFGETIPFAGLLGPIIDLFNLPYSALQPVTNKSALVEMGDNQLLGSICYEIAFGRLMKYQAAKANYILNVSNDTWFGDSIGPHQHLQIARYRALELGKELARGTNNGITAVVDVRGNIRERAEQFQSLVLNTFIQPYEGGTPYSRWGDWPAFFIVLTGLSLCIMRRKSSS
ncbi:MAG TPA: apolipoprotein N-acyltransferase [Gammaproteobacteria bacterium]|nr:apolipoprotein N-acyltransferase [Gammaproteobacteria bacterium]